ncbi:MAG: hypothetical protein GXX99_00300 [Clostridiales bacterium]|nr:hypothetical protein [Clostridiales bacterium]
MDHTRTLTIHLPEALAAQVDLLLQISGGDLDELAATLFTRHTEQSVQALAQRQGAAPAAGGRARADITPPMIAASYAVAKEVYSGALTRSEGKDRVHALTGMNGNSAQDYINNFLAMMDGEVYHRTMSTAATAYFLRHIHADYGAERFKLAVGATQQHIAYYQAISGAPSRKRVKLIEALQKELLQAEPQ